MEWLCRTRPASAVSAALFDFDGTISTLRCGWESVMAPMMVELIGGGEEPDGELVRMVREYIDESTGIQTIFQMKWLVEQVHRYGKNKNPQADPWVYKAEYNRRLMETVSRRRRSLLEGRCISEDFMIRGSRECLETLCGSGIAIYVASGTDDADVRAEIKALGLTQYFAGIMGAPAGREDCSKEAVIRMLIEEKNISGEKLAVIGDGKVEIAIGRENGARTLGVASNERAREGMDEVKRARLIRAGADAITGDFTDVVSLGTFFYGTKVDSM